MPAGKDEIIEAREEGVKLIAMASPVEFLGADGKVTGIHLVRRKETDYGATGAGARLIFRYSDFFLECDGIVTAINQDVDHKIPSDNPAGLDRKGRIDVHQFTSRTSEEGVFAGGDTSPWGANVAVNAIADGKKAAVNIDKYLGGSGELNMGEWLEIPVIPRHGSDRAAYEIPGQNASCG